MALPDSRLRASLLDELEVRVIDAAGGELEAPIGEWSRNSLGSMQGGVVATIVDAAAEVAARARHRRRARRHRHPAHLPRARAGRPDAHAGSRCSAAPPDAVATASRADRRRGRNHASRASPGSSRPRSLRGAPVTACRRRPIADYHGPDTGRDVSRTCASSCARSERGRERRAASSRATRRPRRTCAGRAAACAAARCSRCSTTSVACAAGWPRCPTAGSSRRTSRRARFALAHVGPFRIDARVLRQGRASVVTAVEIRDEGARRRARRRRRADVGDPRAGERPAASGPGRWCSRPGEPRPNRRAADPRVARRGPGRRHHGRDAARTRRCATRGASCTAARSRRSSTSRPSTSPAASPPTSCCTSSRRIGSGRCARTRAAIGSRRRRRRCCASRCATKAPTGSPRSRS